MKQTVNNRLMANQYKTGPSITEKCSHPNCKNQVRRTPSQVRRDVGKYCSGTCAKSQPRKFKEAEKDFIMQHLKLMSRKQLAEHFRISPETFHKLCHSMRSEGYAIPMNSGNPNPTKRVSSLTEEQKAEVLELYPVRCIPAIAEKLKVKAHVIRSYVDAVNREEQKLRKSGKPVVHKKVVVKKKVKQAKHVAQRELHDRKPPVTPFKQKEQVFKTRVVSQEGLIPVVFNDKNHTRMWAKDEAHAERIRRTYAYLEKPLVARL